MADYYGYLRTNYFHVKDEQAFRRFMTTVYGYDDTVQLWEKKDVDGKTVFGFGVFGGIAGVSRAKRVNIYEASYDEFKSGLQKHVAENDAILIFEVGHLKLCYVTGVAEIITSKEQRMINIENVAIETASNILGNPLWKTECCY